ncbi:MAG: O-antigen ligase family protein [Bacteroidia bacterium]
MVGQSFRERFLSPSRAVFLSFCLFVITFYNPVTFISNVAIELMGIAWLYSGNYRNIAQLWKSKAVLGLLIWYLFQILTITYSVNKGNAFKWMEYRASLAYMPLIIGTAFLKKEEIRKILLLFAWTTVCAAILAILYGTAMVIHTGDTGYLYNDSLGILYEKQAVYLAMYVNFAVIILLGQLHENRFAKKLYRNLALFAVLFLTAFVYLLACRTALLLLLLVLGGYVFYMIFKQKRYLSGGMLVLGFLLASVMSYKLFPKAASRLLFVTQTAYTFESKGESDHFNGEHKAENWNSVNTRLAIWACSREVIAGHLLFGTGIGDSEDALISQYEKHNFDFAIKYRLNSHNQYLDVILTYGLLGLFLFLTVFFILTLRVVWKRKDFLFLFFVVSMGVYMITEVMLSRNQGTAFIAFFITLMSVPAREEA